MLGREWSRAVRVLVDAAAKQTENKASGLGLAWLHTVRAASSGHAVLSLLF